MKILNSHYPQEIVMIIALTGGVPRSNQRIMKDYPSNLFLLELEREMDCQYYHHVA